jgi:hypothetical protein
MVERTVRREWAGVALVAAAACVGAVLFTSHIGRASELEACTPCTSGPGCMAGCLSQEMVQARTQQLAQTVQARTQGTVMHTSLHDQAHAIERKNEALLQMSKGQRSKGLGGVLDAAVKQVLRAEAAEVKLRRQAELSKGASVDSVYKSLSPSDRELFKLRAREYELALKEADKDLITASNVMAPLTPAVAPHDAQPEMKAPTHVQKLVQQKPSWTSAMSNLISSEFTDGHGAAWGVGKKAVREQVHARSEFRKGKLPGVEMNNWELTKGRLAMKPKGDDPLLPGVRTHGW